MLKLEVFHAAFEESPRHVATLTTAQGLEAALEEAFIGTNTVETCWVSSRGQMSVPVEPAEKVVADGGCRSTSVGDYVRVTDERGNESFHRCTPLGWRKITDLAELNMPGGRVSRAARKT
jgi:hypothetical protein